MTPEETRATEAGRAAKREEIAISGLMATYEGRWWMADLLDFCQPVGMRYRFDGDVNGAMVRDGMANVGAMMLEQIERHAPDFYAKMMRERRIRIERAKEAAEKTRKAAAATSGDVSGGVTEAEELLDVQTAYYANLAAAAEKPKGQ